MPNLDVRALLSCPSLRLAGGAVVERRTPAQANAFGEMRSQIASTLTLDPVVVHNMTSRDLARMDEADRTTEMIQGYSTARVYAGDDGFIPDVVQYNGRRWRVVKVQDYGTQGGVYIWNAALIEAGAA